MNELEAKLLDIDVEATARRLRELGAREGDRLLQRRYVYDVQPEVPGKWIRLRTNGIVASLAVKTITSNTIDGVRELETAVPDFDGMAGVLTEMGLRARNYQENWRTSYSLSDAELSIDEWPGIPPYLEIEASSPESVLSTARKLGFEESELKYINTVDVYTRYGIDLLKIERLDTNWGNDLLQSATGDR
jgi:adenylate cyclase, class 2